MANKQYGPKLAPQNYRECKPIETRKTMMCTEYFGSGIAINDHPQYQLFLRYGDIKECCDHCKSTNVVCIFFVHYVSNAGHGIQYELECRDCGQYIECSIDEG